MKSQEPELIEGFRGRLKRWEGAVSGRQYSTPHMKCFFRYREAEEAEGSDLHQRVEMSWFLLTSSNLSQAAWGVFQSNKRQLYIKSFEMGVLFLPSLMKTLHRRFSCSPSHPLLGSDLSISIARDHNTTSVFLCSHQTLSRTEEKNLIFFPVPFQVPAPSYRNGEDYPWIWDIPYQKPDRLGRKRDNS